MRPLTIAIAVLLVGCSSSGNDAGDDDVDVDALVVAAGSESACDIAFTQTVDYRPASDSLQVSTVYVAELAAPQDVTRIWSRHCGVEYFGAQPGDCPANATCTGNPAPPADCSIQSGGDLVDGKIRVTCGSKLVVTNSGVATSYGQRSESVTVWYE